MNLKSEKTMIFEYVKNRKGYNVGVVLAKCCADNHVRVGFSLCNVNSGDTFNKVTAISMAEGRAERSATLTIPRSLENNIARIMHRAEKHFKDKPCAFFGRFNLSH
jgi:hypothetical protein